MGNRFADVLEPKTHEYRTRPTAVLASALVYVAVTAIMGRAVLGAIGAAIASDAGDPLLVAAILVWNATTVPWTSEWFQFPIFHPTPDALTLSEHLLGASLIASPLYWLTENAILAYNVTWLLTFPLCGLAMYALVWRLTRSSPAAFLAGLAFAFAPYRASQLSHLPMLMVFWAPLALLGLHAFVESAGPPSGEPAPRPPTRGRRPIPQSMWAGFRDRTRLRTRRAWLALFAVSWLLQAASNGYFLVYFSVLVGLWVLWFLMAGRRWRDAARVAFVLVLAALPLAPILYRYLARQRALGLERNLGEMASFSADIAAPLCASPSLTFWGWLRVACGQEGELFAGAGLTAMSVLGAIAVVKGRLRGVGEPHRATPRLRAAVVRTAGVIALVYIGIAASVLIAGPWRMDVGWFRASASSVDKPVTVAFVMLLAAALLSSRFLEMVRRGSTATFYLLAAIACWVLSWGPFPRLFGSEVLYQAPFAWLLQVPGAGGLRVPARFWMLTVLCLVVFMGLVIARVLQGRSRTTKRALVVAAACALLADGWMTIPAAAVPEVVPKREALRGATVVVLPLGDPALDVAAVYHAVTGGWRLVNGFSGYEPVYYEALRTLSRDRDMRLLDPFLARGALHVVDRTAGFREYRMSARPMAAEPRARGRRLDVRPLAASCAPEGMAYASDGDIETAWVCGTQAQDQEITLELAAVTPIAAVVHALGSAGAFFPRHLVIETSTDGAGWTQAWSGSPAAAVLNAAMRDPRQTRVVVGFPRRDARYVRLRQTGRHEINYWSIAELEVWTGAE